MMQRYLLFLAFFTSVMLIFLNLWQIIGENCLLFISFHYLCPRFNQSNLIRRLNNSLKMEQNNVKPADGKLGIMVVGCGAVSTTFMTGVLMARKGLTKPVGSMTQYDKIVWARAQTRSICTTRISFLLPTSTISYSAPGMSILRMPIRLPCMPRF